VVSFDRSLLKGEAPRLSADFNHPLLYERPFKFTRHLVEPLGIDNIIAMSAINICRWGEGTDSLYILYTSDIHAAVCKYMENANSLPTPSESCFALA
jgi:hypothetical protein